MPGLRKPARRGAIASAIALMLGLAGCDGGQIAADEPGQSQTYSGSGYQATVFSAGHLVVAPKVSGITVTGKPLSLSAYRGDIIVLNFWGSWCDPCRQEAPTLGTVARQLYPRGVRFVGVDIRDEPDSAIAFTQQFRITYPSISDPDDEIALSFRSSVPPDALPDIVIINRDGRIAAAIIGSATYDNLTALIAKIAAQGHTAGT